MQRRQEIDSGGMALSAARTGTKPLMERNFLGKQ
jgi:hypothetical protein